MLYFIYGNPQKASKKAEELVEKMLSKRPESEVFKMSTDNWDINKLSSWLEGQSLFSPKYIIRLSRILEDEESKENIFSLLKEIEKSEHVFVWNEGEVKKTDLTKIEKRSEKVQSFEEVKISKSRDTDLFDLSDALGERDPKKLWLLYLDKSKKYSIEEIHGTLWWQLKSMVIASRSSNPSEAKLKPFVYSKSKKYTSNYSIDELDNILDSLCDIYHEARMGKVDFETSLEKFCLSI